MATTTTYETEILNGRKFEWQVTDYRSPTGGDYTRSGYKIDGKRVSWRAFYKALAEAKAAADDSPEDPDHANPAYWRHCAEHAPNEEIRADCIAAAEALEAGR